MRGLQRSLPGVRNLEKTRASLRREYRPGVLTCKRSCIYIGAMPLRALNTIKAICSRRDCSIFHRSDIQDFALPPFCSLDCCGNARNRCNEETITMDSDSRSARVRATLLNVAAKRMQHFCSNLRTKERLDQ